MLYIYIYIYIYIYTHIHISYFAISIPWDMKYFSKTIECFLYILIILKCRWIKLKTHSPTYFPSPQDNIFLTVTEKNISWNYFFSAPTRIYLFEFSNNNSRIKCKICSKLTVKASVVVLSSNILNQSMHLRVRSRSNVTFKAKLYATTINSSFQPLPIFLGIGEHTPTPMIWKKYEKFTMKIVQCSKC